MLEIEEIIPIHNLFRLQSAFSPLFASISIFSLFFLLDAGLYVDYNRGATTGNLRLTEPKPTEMKVLVDKLTDESITIANEKVESAVILEGEKEEEYWKEFNIFLNNRKRI